MCYGRNYKKTISYGSMIGVIKDLFFRFNIKCYDRNDQIHLFVVRYICYDRSYQTCVILVKYIYYDSNYKMCFIAGQLPYLI